MLDFTPVDKMDPHPSPRILNSHYPPHLLPRQIKDRRNKIVYIYRNPKDVAVSTYYHLSKSLDMMMDANVGDLKSFIPGFLKDNCKYL